MAQSHLAKWFSGRVAWLGRSRGKYTQTDVANFLGKKYQAVANLEQGKVFPSVERLLRARGPLQPQRGAEGVHDRHRAQRSRAELPGRPPLQRPLPPDGGAVLRRDLQVGATLPPGHRADPRLPLQHPAIAEGSNDEQLNRGWSFKDERIKALLARIDKPKVVILISEVAMWNLRFLSEEDRQEQLDRLRELDALPNWEIKIVPALHPEAGGALGTPRPAKAEFGGPAFAYTEVWDNSWCIEETDRIGRYDHLWKILLGKSIMLKEYLDD